MLLVRFNVLFFEGLINVKVGIFGLQMQIGTSVDWPERSRVSDLEVC